jgi:hypothetical protein
MVGEPSAEFAPVDLLNDFDILTARLDVELVEQRWQDAYLLAAGAAQVIDDFVRRGGASPRRAARYIATSGFPASGMTAAAARGGGTAIDRFPAMKPGTRALGRYRRSLGALLDALATLVMHPAATPTAQDAQWIATTAVSLSRSRSALPTTLTGQILRLPACFRSMDQHPDDLRAFAARFADRWPDRNRALLVVGVRTSGSYLAPLFAAALRTLGYPAVGVLTIRPGDPLLGRETAVLRQLVRDNGMALILDDPPITGRSMAQVARRLHQAGLAESSTVALLARCESQPGVLPPLSALPQLSLAGPDWRIIRELRVDAVSRALRDVLPPTIELAELTARTTGLRPVRGHLRASYTAELYDQVTRELVTRDIFAEGVGLGYFGRHAAAVGHALHGWVSDVYGFTDGLLLRDGGPSRADQVHSWSTPREAERVADYVLTRCQALPAAKDRSMQLSGQEPAWEVAATRLCGVLGKLGIPLRIPLIDPIVRRLLTVSSPMVIDGRMGPENWHPAPTGPAQDQPVELIKEEFAEGAFSNRELYCYDPVFDLAGASVGFSSPQFTHRLCERYIAESGQPIPLERWLVYHLVHLSAAAEVGRMSQVAAARASALAVQQYLARIYLEDVKPHADGPYGALDIDGVLEISPLGFSMTTRAGAIALRALLAHGYQTVLATGRNLADIQDRCESYGLPGAVGEYGGVVYHRATGRVDELVGDRELADLARLRDALTGMSGIRVDPGHRLTVRAHRGVEGDGSGLARNLAESAVRASGLTGRVRIVHGDRQTDFVPVSVSKERGLRHLLAGLHGSPQPPPLAFAVGDGPADADMLAMATVGLATGNADPALRSGGVRRTGAHCQAGLAQAVAVCLGHRPGGCATCRMPRLSEDARQLMTLLSVCEGGRRGAPTRLVRLALQAAVARWLR